MNLTLPALIILLLPGFFALWVYQGFCYEDVHKRGETHMISLGLMFGMIALGVYALLDKAARHRLAIPFAENPAALISLSFAWKYAVLSGAALLVGLVSGLLCRLNLTPTALLRRLGARILRVNETQNTESLLHVYLQDHTKDGAQAVVEIKSGSDKVMGFYGGDGLDSDGEIQLNNINLFNFLTDEQKRYLSLLPARAFLRPNGHVVTVKPLAESQYLDLFEELDTAAANEIESYKREISV